VERGRGIHPEDGTVLRVDPYNITFLFKRLGGSEDRPSTRVRAAAAAGKARLITAPAPADTTTTVLRMLDDYSRRECPRSAKFLDFFVGTEDLTVFETTTFGRPARTSSRS